MLMAYCEQFEVFLTAHKRCSMHTVSAYMRDVRAFADFCANGHMTMVNDQAISLYLWHLKKERGLSARSVARAIASLRSFVLFLTQEHIAVDVCVERITVPKQRVTIPEVVNQEKITQLLQALQADKSRRGLLVRTIIFLLYGTGMRVSELVRLTLADVHLDERLIKVRGKGAKERLIPVSEQLELFLIDYFERVRPHLLKKRESEYVFAHYFLRRVRPFTRQVIWYTIATFGKAHGLRLYPHIMRHSMATHLLHNGVDLRSLQVLLGHEQVTTTQVYTHVDTRQLRTVYDAKHLRTK